MSTALERWFDKRLSPIKDYSLLQDTFDRFLHEMISLRKESGDFNFEPFCEFSEDAKNYVFKVDLPGMSRENIKVEVDGNLLTITANRREEKKKENNKKHLSEIYYGSYLRSFMLPGEVNKKKLYTKFSQGVLTVTVPKAGIKGENYAN